MWPTACKFPMIAVRATSIVAILHILDGKGSFVIANYGQMQSVYMEYKLMNVLQW